MNRLVNFVHAEYREAHFFIVTDVLLGNEEWVCEKQLLVVIMLSLSSFTITWLTRILWLPFEALWKCDVESSIIFVEFKKATPWNNLLLEILKVVFKKLQIRIAIHAWFRTVLFLIVTCGSSTTARLTRTPESRSFWAHGILKIIIDSFEVIDEILVLDERSVITVFGSDICINLFRQYSVLFYVLIIEYSNCLDVEWVLFVCHFLWVSLFLLQLFPGLDDQLLLILNQQHFWVYFDVNCVIIINESLFSFLLRLCIHYGRTFATCIFSLKDFIANILLIDSVIFYSN